MKAKSRGTDIPARIIAIVSLAATMILGILGLVLQYRQVLSVDIDRPQTDYVHVLTIHQSKGHMPVVARIAVWRDVLLTNTSNRSLSVVSVALNEGNVYKNEAIKPAFRNVTYDSSGVLLAVPIEYPLVLGAGESTSFSMLLPIHVSQEVGTLLYDMMRTGRPSSDTAVASTIGSPTFFDELQMDRDFALAQVYSQQDARLDLLTFDTIDLTRILLRRTPEGYRFLDADNSAPDGFRYDDGAILFAHMLQAGSVFEKIPLSSYALDYDQYVVEFQTGSGRNYKFTISSRTLPFYSYSDAVRTEIDRQLNK